MLNLRHEYGGLTRVIGPKAIQAAEAGGLLPELYTLGAQTMYEAIYDADGVLEAARRWHDPALINRCQAFIAALYGNGEPLDEYFARAVAPLEPPAEVSRMAGTITPLDQQHGSAYSRA
ncbi:DUF6879 family protein [Actinoplanes sp. NBRC 101535]|uniref:DUF6879 family protein n=1 Tax=Actinoplanes sp. NBRC 101535 TaxID=3032196 RepID=UPI0024A19EE1|nr:DUF6879 family protein [Actinoplanes sp. NBRC 101535]GLY05032.1 hypothetical protein Acsp01_54110 [Actinoplanes sp. NBRC 101535]